MIALPPALHAAALNRVLDAGVSAYVEKPIATRSADVVNAVSAAEARGAVTMTGCNLRFLPAFREIKKIIDAGVLGRTLHAALSVGQWLPDWRPGRDYRASYSARSELGGGAIFDLIHEIDLARYWFGDFDGVSAVAGNTGALEIDCEDHADMLFSSSNLNVSVHVDYLDRQTHRQGRIICTEGTMHYDVVAGALMVREASAEQCRPLTASDSFDVRASARAAMTHFLAALKAGTQTELPLSQGLATLRLAEKARAAAGLAP